MDRRSFIGGLLASAAALSLGVSSQSVGFLISADYCVLPSGAFIGQVAVVAIYDHVLTASESTEIYRQMCEKYGFNFMEA